MSRPPDKAARIGPNAVTRLAEAIEARHGPEGAAAVFLSAGLADYLDAPPGRMVREDEVARLHHALAQHHPREEAQALARDAGERTARYLLAARIPRPFQRVLRWLPARMAARSLLWAIARHAWTFCGSARFEAAIADPVCVRLDGGLAAAPAPAVSAAYYAAVFEALFRALVDPRCRALTHPTPPDGLTVALRW